MNLPIAMKLKSSHARRGFSLVEMAIVLTIVAVLMAGLLPKLSGQIEQGRRAETRKVLAEIQQALIGYAVIHGSLPCPVNPATQNDPAASAVYGLPEANCSGPIAEGYLPWKALGVPEMDPWGVKRTDAASLWIGYWRYRVDPNFASSSVPFTLGISNAIDLQVQDNAGNTLTNTSPSDRPLAVIFSTGPNVAADGENADYEVANAVYQSDVQGKNLDGSEFDDITVWLSRPTLFSRMVQAGKLP